MAISEEPIWWINHYRCPHCENQWQDGWSCQVNDECGDCGVSDIEPYYSDDGSGSEADRLLALAQADAGLEEDVDQTRLAPGAG